MIKLLKEMDKNKRTAILVLAIVIGVIVIIGGIQIALTIARGSRPVETPAYNVKVLTLKKQPVDIVLTLTGMLEGDPDIQIFSDVPGKFSGNVVTEGTFVNKNQVIAYVDRDVVGAVYKLSSVETPISGTVTKLYYVDKGASITPINPIATISNIDTLKTVIAVGESDLQYLKKGQKVILSPVNWDKSITFTGIVNSVTPYIDKDNLSGTVIIQVPNPDKKLIVGLTVSADVFTDAKPMFQVPESVVLINEAGAYVYVNKNNKAKLVPVTTGYRKNDMVEIIAKNPQDLNDNDQVVTEGSFKLFDGAPIAIIEK